MSAPTADELVAHANRAHGKAAAAGAIADDGDDGRDVILEGRVIAGAVRYIGVFRERGEAVLAASQNRPSLLRDVGGSFVVFALEGGRR